MNDEPREGSKMRIAVILPVQAGPERVAATQAAWQTVASPTTDVVVLPVDDGPAQLLTEAEGIQARPPILKCVREAANVDAIIVSCFCDPALEELRSIVDVPVIGVGEASMSVARQWGRRFVIATVVDTSYMERIVEDKGFAANLASVRPISVHPRDFIRDRSVVMSEITEGVRDASATEDAEMVLLGCCGLTAFREDVEAATGMPALEPKSVAVCVAETAVRLMARASNHREAPPRRALAGAAAVRKG